MLCESVFFFFKQKTAYEMRISDWSSDVCSSDLAGRPDRFNFGGRYDCQRTHDSLTGLRMILNGFDEASGKITDLDGGMALIDAANEIAASWTFKGMMAHCNRKHAQAAYVPSLFRTPPPEYKSGAHVLL